MKPLYLLSSLLITCLASLSSTCMGASNVSSSIQGSSLIMKNSICQVEFDAHTGDILSFNPGPASLRGPWFEVVEEDRAGMEPWETWKHGKESVFKSGPCKAETSVSGDVATLKLVWDRPSGIRITGEIILGANDKGPRFRLSVANNTGNALVDTIRLPILRGVQIGDGDDDWFTWPHTLGARFRVNGFKPGDMMEEPYPAFMYMQWLDIYGKSQGVYAGCMDDYGYSKKMFIGRDDNGKSVMGIALVGCWIAKKGDSWTTPWVQIAAHKGDWRAGADIYRPFAEKAFGPLFAPERIREMPTSQCWLAHFASDGDVGKLFEIQQQAPIHASYLMKSVNTSTPEGWDGMRGSALELHDSFDKIKQLGGGAALFTFDRAPLMGKTNYANYASKWTCVRRDGSIEQGFRDMMPAPFDPDFVRARVGEAVRWVREFGLDEIHYDTEGTCGDTGDVGTGMLAGPSYRMDMPYRPNEVPHYFKELYRATVKACRKYNPDFTLRAEHGADFFFPEFAASTAHFFETSTGTVVMAHNPPQDAELMPNLFMYTLPSHAAMQMPSVSLSDLWTFCYGMGHGFHGGGASWCFNPEARNPESPFTDLYSLYNFYDSDWHKYYDFRVGFEEATIDAEKADVLAEAQIDGAWKKCEYPGPVVAVTHIGGGREVTLGQWYPAYGTSAFGSRYTQNRMVNIRPIKLRVPTKIVNPQIRLYDAYKEIPANATVKNGTIELNIQDPLCFALEVFSGPEITLSLPQIAEPGKTVEIALSVKQIGTKAGIVDIQMPAGWPEIKPVAVAAGKSFSKKIPVSVPDGIFGRNYPIKAVLKIGKFTRTTASHLKVMQPLTVNYTFDTVENGQAKEIYALEPGKQGRLTIKCINNRPSSGTVSIKVTGAHVTGNAVQKLDGISSRELGSPESPIIKWIKDKGPQPVNVYIHSFDFDCKGVSNNPEKIEIKLDGETVFKQDVYPRTRIMDLNGDWKVGFTKASTADVGGAERYDAIDTEAVTPNVWDGKWKTYKAPFTLTADDHKANSWAYYRRLVYIPAEWQGTDIQLHVNKLGAPWGEGGTLNIVYINGWPAGRIGPSGDRSVSSFMIFGGWNLLTVASNIPSCMIDPYLFVRNVPDPGRIKPADAGSLSEKAFLLMGRQCTGQGITMPFIKGVPGDGFRSTNVKLGGEYEFMYFAVADDFIYDSKHPVEVEVEYLDKGTSPFNVDYDSTDTSAPINGAFKSAESINRTDTGEWKTSVFQLYDAKFTNREHQGSDFRIHAFKDDLIIKRIEVRKIVK